MQLSTLDWIIVFGYFAVVLLIGIWVSRRSSGTSSDFFLSGRDMPWWLLGVSMVATTFSADTPNLVTDLVRQNGVAGNWGWWAFLLTGMLTVFVFARMWRRSMVMTDVEFYEIRYSGPAAAFLRGFRALYLGLIFNVLVMGAVSLAAIKFGEIVLGWPGWQTLLVGGAITLVYSVLGGLRAVIITDFIQFVLAMIGSVWACIYILNLDQVGGVGSLLTHTNVADKINLLPDMSDPAVWVPVLLVPLAVQWWASYYPGSEPGGGGYIAQRIFSAKDEKNAVGAALLFNVAHYALRPWPWILIAFASLVAFPTLSDIQSVFPLLSEDKLGHDVAYPAMLTLLPSGLLGLVAASLMAAFMSTMSTQLNLGASYLVNDFYVRFFNEAASESLKVMMGRVFTLLSAVMGLGLGLFLTNAAQAFEYMLLLGAGTGLIYILRWFWWRINACTEIIAMVVSLIIAYYFTFVSDSLESWQELVIGSLITTAIWMVSVYLTPQTDDAVLATFYKKIKPMGSGWDSVRERMSLDIEVPNRLPFLMLCFVLGTISIYAALFATGNWIYGNYTLATGLTALAAVGAYFILRNWQKISVD